MRKVKNLLVVRVGVNGVHVATLDAELLKQHLGHRSQAVRGAGSVGDDVVLFLVVLIVVDAHDDGDVLALRGAGDDDLLGAGLDVLGCKLAGLEDARGLNNDVDAELAPRQILGIALAQHLHRVAICHETVFSDLDRVERSTVDGVIFQQVSHRRDVAEIVDGHNLDSGVLDHGAIRQTSDAAETVDAYFDCHCVSPSH